MADKNINNLAIAERKAAEIINKANERKSKMSADAERDALKELAVIKERLTKEFEKKSYDISDETVKVDAQTKIDIESVYKLYEKNYQICLDFMMDSIGKVDCNIPKNLTVDFNTLGIESNRNN